jgi:hypothetical protein
MSTILWNYNTYISKEMQKIQLAEIVYSISDICAFMWIWMLDFNEGINEKMKTAEIHFLGGRMTHNDGS